MAEKDTGTEGGTERCPDFAEEDVEALKDRVALARNLLATFEGWWDKLEDDIFGDLADALEQALIDFGTAVADFGAEKVAGPIIGGALSTILEVAIKQKLKERLAADLCVNKDDWLNNVLLISVLPQRKGKRRSKVVYSRN